MIFNRIAAITALGVVASIGIAQTESQTGNQGTGNQAGAGSSSTGSNGGASSDNGSQGQTVHKRHHKKKSATSQDPSASQDKPYPSDAKPSGSSNNGSTTDSTRPQ